MTGIERAEKIDRGVKINFERVDEYKKGGSKEHYYVTY